MNASSLTLLVLRIGFLIVLWSFVFVIVYTLRSDLFGPRAKRLPDDAAGGAPAAGGTPHAAPPASPSANPDAALGGLFAGLAAAPTGPVTPARQAPPEPLGSDDEHPLAGLAIDRTGSVPTVPGEPTAPTGGRQKATVFNASKLVITGGPRAGVEYELTNEPLTIGRSSESGLVIRDDYTSTHHARLMLWNNDWMLQDLDSTNGTFLDGERVTAPTQVPLDTPIKVGMTTFELRR
ncbi:FHA domain-containing protein FhaB/FipA [Gryllotalpicola ginsengisoli]|uniref:FHA domain-containing protein FhaB/FipA n=1 Tax=Gryllotalpicola ginsengisoli TaxID=444608 RepID=UPI0003B516B6|nr:FHA domain-containing protein [Gryllotalpicola ginsengisoli]